MQKNTFLVDGRRLLSAKPELTKEYLSAKYPTKKFERPGKAPSIRTMEKWLTDGVALTPICRCRVEPDGHCPHGRSSWLICMGLI